jgi:hypothetical protein
MAHVVDGASAIPLAIIAPPPTHFNVALTLQCDATVLSHVTSQYDGGRHATKTIAGGYFRIGDPFFKVSLRVESEKIIHFLSFSWNN